MTTSLQNNALAYLGCSGEPDASTLSLLEKAKRELAAAVSFRHLRCRLTDLPALPDFLAKECYGQLRAYLPEASLYVATLGLETDRLIRRKSANRLAEAVTLNALANAWLDMEVERTAENGEVLFCPGYSGTDFSDNIEILNALNATKLLGIHTAPSGIMIPEKSVAGIMVRGFRFTCKGCLIQSKCEYLKQKKTCYTNR